MKIKYSKNFTLKYMPSISSSYIVIGIILRAVQVIFFVDPVTGFATGFKPLFYTLYGLIIGTTLYDLSYCFLSKESEKIDVAGLKSKLLSVAAFVFALFLLAEFIKGLFGSLFTLGDVSGGNTLDLFRSLMMTGTLPNFLGGLFALPSAVYMFTACISFKDGSGIISKHRILALSPLCWVACKFITRFIKQISFVEVSDLLLELVMLGLMITFFQAFAQVSSGVYNDTAKWRLIALGLSSAMLTFIINVPRIILFFIGKLNAEYPFYAIDVLFGIFAFTLVAELIKSIGTRKEDTEEKSEEV